MGDKSLKRSWLRLVGDSELGEASRTELTRVTASTIDATLGSIRGDDFWVALACVEAIEKVSLSTNDVTTTRHLLSIGLQHSIMDTNAEDIFGSPRALYQLAIRKVLLKYRRMMTVWEQLFHSEGRNNVGDVVEIWEKQEKFVPSDTENNDDDDAWAEAAETTPSPVATTSNHIALSDFISQSPLAVAIHLASSHQYRQLTLLLKALPSSLYEEIYLKRLNIVKLLLLSAASAEVDIDTLLQMGLLPSFRDGQEFGLWNECRNPMEAPDATDTKEVVELLLSHGLITSEEHSHESTREPLSPSSLLSFYLDCITTLESRSGSISASIELARIVSSDQMRLPPNEGLNRLTVDLQLLMPLVYGAASCSTCSSWTLNRLREELHARPDLEERQSMAVLYLEEAQSPHVIIEGSRNGVVPFLRIVTHRHVLQLGEEVAEDMMVKDGFIQVILKLADKGRVATVNTLLSESAACGIELNGVERGRIALAALIGSTKLDQANIRQYDQLALSASSELSKVAPGGENPPLRQYVGPDFHPGNGTPSTPSRIHQFLLGLEQHAISYHLQRCRVYLSAIQRLSAWNNLLTLPWLADVQGQREEQIGCVTRVIRTFARDTNPSQQWKHLIDSLVECVGRQEALDTLEEKDVARLIAEGALRTSDLRIFSLLMKERCLSQLSDKEREEIVLSASREFYDNATSANLYSGDMKIAYEILSQNDVRNTPKIEQEKAFMEASSRLCSFRVQSSLRPGVLLAPIEIRLSTDRLDFIKKLLESKEDAYKTPDLILEIATKLCAVPSGAATGDSQPLANRQVVESKTLSLLTEAALGQADYTRAQVSCERLIQSVTTISKRVEQSAVTHGANHESLQRIFLQISEIAYRSCFYLCNQQEWIDYASRLRWCSYVLAYCPDEQVEKYLKTWRHLERQYQEELFTNPSQSKDWSQVADQLKPGQGSLANSLASIGGIGGGLGALESLSPFSTLFASTRLSSALSRGSSSLQDHSNAPISNTSNSIGKSTTSTVGSSNSPTSRTARLFDSLGGGSPSNDAANSGYLDPAERAARAARRFFSGFGS
ncbi:hypothetical protein CBS101457_002242 [Exobasidium rhododendri]|nr:hypothetical protein CBS101457_002242 [Exobasidium rhododendri]